MAINGLILSQMSPHLQAHLQDSSRLNFFSLFYYISSFTFPGSLFLIFLQYFLRHPSHFYIFVVEQQQQQQPQRRFDVYYLLIYTV